MVSPTWLPPTSASDFTASQLDDVLAGNWRLATNSARDVYRHPKATLQFFGVRPDQTIVEITPGGGWYSEILAPLLNDNGHYVAAVAAPKNGDEARRDDSALQRKFAADPAHYSHAQIVQFDPHAPVFGAPDWVPRWFAIAGALGFPFWILFAWFFEFTPEGIKRERDVDPGASITHQTGRKLDFWIIGVLAVLVIVLLFVLLNGDDEEDGVTPTTVVTEEEAPTTSAEEVVTTTAAS